MMFDNAIPQDAKSGSDIMEQFEVAEKLLDKAYKRMEKLNLLSNVIRIEK